MWNVVPTKTAVVILFVLASFLASALLFAVEPMIGKMVLPVFGGTPAVWNTCLVFFQGTLLCGYLLSHGMRSTGVTGRGRVSGFYLLALAGLLAGSYLMLPFALERADERTLSLGSRPAFVLLGDLCRSTALPLVLISATAPLVQGWFVLIGHRRSQDPYFLYAASNAGSLLALVSYPFLIEPNLGLATQSRYWSTGFLVLATLVLACGVVTWLRGRSLPKHSAILARDEHSTYEDMSLAARVWWIVLVLIPASWLMSVTTYLTTDLAPVPLMWIIPLSLYLLSFIVAFSSASAGAIRAATVSLPYLLVPLVLVMFAGFVHVWWIPLHLAAFFGGALACHGRLAQKRPAPRYLSSYYVTIALGGLIGGIANALVAPVVFNRVVEYPLALIFAALIVPSGDIRMTRQTLSNGLRDLVFAGVVTGLAVVLVTNQAGLADSTWGAIGVTMAAGLGVLSCVTARRRPMRFAFVIAGVLAAGGFSSGVSGRLLNIERDFFGVLRVTYDAEHNANRLFHGSTLHGQQSLDPALRYEPLTYFTRTGPIGQVFDATTAHLNRPGTRVAIVGLGVGTLASYSQPSQRWTFYEIDGAVERIARDPRFFTYLQDCQAEAVEIILGDARQRMKDAPDHAYQLIVLDAFSSDALPVHLLSREAIRLYRDKLTSGGLLMFNLTNRYLDLEPVIGRQANDAGLVCRICYDVGVSDVEKHAGKQPSIWAVVAEHEVDLAGLVDNPHWQTPRLRPGSAVWTDDYSDLAAYLLFKFRRSAPSQAAAPR